MDSVELMVENIGEDELPLMSAMGVDYTTGEVKKMILSLVCLLAELGGDKTETETNEKVLLALLAFVSMEPLPDGLEEISDCDRYSCLRALDTVRKDENTGTELKQHIFLVQYLLRGYACHCK